MHRTKLASLNKNSEAKFCLKMLFVKTSEPTHKIMALFVLRKLIVQMRKCTIQWWLIFGQTLRLLSYFICVNSEGSGETALMPRLTSAFAGHLCDKYHDLMGLLINALIGINPQIKLSRNVHINNHKPHINSDINTDSAMANWTSFLMCSATWR